MLLHVTEPDFLKKVFLYFCINLMLGKNLVPETWAKILLNLSDCRIFKLTISPERSDETA